MSDAHEFTTQDLALATMLKLNGYEPVRMERVEGGCRWVYPPIDSEFQDRVNEYRNGEAWVEPKEFVRKLALVRREMYAFLGQTPKRIQTQTA